MRRRTRNPIIAVFLWAVVGAHSMTAAHAIDTPSLAFDGFGTVGLVHSNEDRADFVSNPFFVPRGVGHSDRWSLRVDSRLGAQLTARFTPRASGVVQVLAEHRYDDTYTPTLEWAYADFELSPAIGLRAGRMVLPVSMVSEFRKVGYANPWVRPPQEVYGLLSITNIDGVELDFRSRFDSSTNSLRVTAGSRDTRTAGGGTAEARGATVVNSLERGASTLFAQVSRYDITMAEFNPLFDAFRQFGPAGAAIADRYDIDDKRFRVIGIGARHDPGPWFATGEWARLSSRSFARTSYGAYATTGYRMGEFTPYLTVARHRMSGPASDPGLSVAGLPADAAGQAGALNAALNELLAMRSRQRTISVGTRWDFARNAALKVQYDYIDLDAGSPGLLVNTQPDFRPGGSVSLFSLTLDFVF